MVNRRSALEIARRPAARLIITAPTRIRPVRLIRYDERDSDGAPERQEAPRTTGYTIALPEALAARGAEDSHAAQAAREQDVSRRRTATLAMQAPNTPRVVFMASLRPRLYDEALDGKYDDPQDEADSPAGHAFAASRQSTAHLMQISGMMRAVRPSAARESSRALVEEWWPHGIQQTGPLPVANLYGSEPFGRSLPPDIAGQGATQVMRGWKALLNSPLAKVTLGLLVGAGLLFLISRVVSIPAAIAILRANLATPRGIICALLSGAAFLTAFSIRGVRWKLFLNPIGEVSTIKAIQLFLVGIFLNFLLPVRGGEVAKSLMLKRVANIPISRSLPTVAMDKALDLMPALFIMALVPLLGVRMDIRLWLVLGAVGGLLLCLICFVILAIWKRAAAIAMLQKLTGLLPRSIGDRIAGFATGFVDALLAGASQPRIFLPALLLTAIAVIFDGLFAMLAFWTVGVPISFGTAIFGYTVYNMFYILPTPPGQVGSNEAIGLLVFSGLLGLDAHGVTAMFFFSHPWAALLMCAAGLSSLSALGLTVSSAMKVQTCA